MTDAGGRTKGSFPAAKPLKSRGEALRTPASDLTSIESPTRLGDERITAKLNEALANEPGGLDPALARIQAESVGPADW